MARYAYDNDDFYGVEADAINVCNMFFKNGVPETVKSGYKAKKLGDCVSFVSGTNAQPLLACINTAMNKIGYRKDYETDSEKRYVSSHNDTICYVRNNAKDKGEIKVEFF